MLFCAYFNEIINQQLLEIEKNFYNLYTHDESLHDFRVSLRRFVAYMTSFKKYININDDILNSARFFLKSSSTVRDRETLIQKINPLQTLDSQLKSLTDFLSQEYNILKSNFYNTISLNLENFLLTAKSNIEHNSFCKEKYSNDTVEEIAKKVLLKQTGRISDIKPNKKHLHKLRIEYKKFRYVLETLQKFQYQDIQIENSIAKLKWLQDKLGYIQDLNAHISYLKCTKSKLFHLSDTIDALIKTFKGTLRQNRKTAIFALSFYRYAEIKKMELKWIIQL